MLVPFRDFSASGLAQQPGSVVQEGCVRVRVMLHLKGPGFPRLCTQKTWLAKIPPNLPPSHAAPGDKCTVLQPPGRSLQAPEFARRPTCSAPCPSGSWRLSLDP